MTSACQRATLLRTELEEHLAEKIPSAFSTPVRQDLERLRSGVEGVDQVLEGLPVGAVSEFVGPECSGRTTLALAYVRAHLAQGKVAAWLDVDDRLDPESVVHAGVNLERLLWVRCHAGHGCVAPAQPAPEPTRTAGIFAQPAGAPVTSGGCGSPHPRGEDRGMPLAIQHLLAAQPRYGALPEQRRDKSIGTPSKPNRPLTWRSTEREEQVATDRQPARRGANLACPAAVPGYTPAHPVKLAHTPCQVRAVKAGWGVLDQALRAADLLLQAGGFGLIVLDLGSTPVERALRIPLATWFRYRAACERTQVSLLLLSRQPCARSAAVLVVRTERQSVEHENSVLTGVDYRAQPERQRFHPAAAQPGPGKLVPIRKPPQPVRPGGWKGRAAWAL